MNTPIKQLVAEYEAETCDFSDLEWVCNTSYRYVNSMKDSQVRCLLYTMIPLVEEYLKLKNPDWVDPSPQLPEFGRVVTLKCDDGSTRKATRKSRWRSDRSDRPSWRWETYPDGYAWSMAHPNVLGWKYYKRDD